MAITDPPATIIRQYLIDESVGVDPTTSSDDWPVYVSVLPDDDNVKDKAIAVIDTTPRKDGRALRTGEVFEHFGIQILVRADTYPNGWTKLGAIMDKLDVASNVSVSYNSSTYKLWAVSRTSFFSLGMETDKRRREIFSVNSLVAIAES